MFACTRIYERTNKRIDRKENIRSFCVLIINLDENARSESEAIPRTSVHVTQFVTSPHVTILPHHASPASSGIVSRFASMSDYTGRTLSCSRWAARTYVPVPPVPHTLVGNTLLLPAESRNGENAISTIQTGHHKVTL